MSTTNRKQTAPTTTTPRLRAPRRPRAEGLTAETPRYVSLGDGSRFEFALVVFAMVAMWVAFVASIVAL